MSKYLILVTLFTGVTYYFWLGFDTPISGHKFYVLNDHSLVALEDTLVAHYSEKVEDSVSGGNQEDDSYPREKISVFLTEFQSNYFDLNRNPRNLDDSFLLTLIASISSPVLEGVKLQASDLYIEHFKKENFSRVYVGFNMKGPKMLGGIQILKLQPPSRNQRARVILEQNILFKDSEIHGITHHENKLYVTGAINNSQFKSPAFL
ncbi:MAG: hypothetical protein NXH75_16460, partial [Halobacteriovoraceae bacterium]|nr:hypothetical protein [Halobacteriovoraceae bacterium]